MVTFTKGKKQKTKKVKNEQYNDAIATLRTDVDPANKAKKAKDKIKNAGQALSSAVKACLAKLDDVGAKLEQCDRARYFVENGIGGADFDIADGLGFDGTIANIQGVFDETTEVCSSFFCL